MNFIMMHGSTNITFSGFWFIALIECFVIIIIIRYEHVPKSVETGQGDNVTYCGINKFKLA